MMKKIFNKGISIIEILIIISIIGAVSVIIVPSFSDFRKEQALKNTTEDVVSLLNKARNNTISSKNSTVYGVHLQSDKATLFEGLFIDGTPTNEIINFDVTVNIPATGGINLTGGGNDILFSRITGDTAQDGTIIIQQVSDATKQKTITINKIGIISSN